MEFASNYLDKIVVIADLFSETFAKSESPEEGKLIGGLAKDLMSITKEDDLFVFFAQTKDVITACIIFSRLTYEQDKRSVFVMAPVAVGTGFQGQGIGQALIKYGLERLRESGVDVAITYGDPKFYSKVGFQKITEEEAEPPLELQYPEGWLAQTLSSDRLSPLAGRSHCVEALNRPEFW